MHNQLMLNHSINNLQFTNVQSFQLIQIYVKILTENVNIKQIV